MSSDKNYSVSLNDSDGRIKESDLTLLAKGFVNGIINNQQMRVPIILFGGEEQHRNYIFEQMKSEFNFREINVHLIQQSSPVEASKNWYFINAGYYLDKLAEGKGVPQFGA